MSYRRIARSDRRERANHMVSGDEPRRDSRTGGTRRRSQLALAKLKGLVVALGSRLRLHSLTLFFVVQRH